MRVSRLPGVHHDSDSILIADKGEAVLINSGTSWYQLISEERIRGQLKEQEQLGHILLSCRRFNYSGAAAHLSESFGAQVHIHSQGINALQIGDHFSTWASRFDSDMPLTTAEELVDEQRIPVGASEIEVIALSGHSTCGMGFYIEEQALLAAGATVPSSLTPARWDMPGGCLPDLVGSIEYLLELELESLLTGQGKPLSGRAEVNEVLQRHSDFFKSCIEADGRFPDGWDRPAPTATFLTPKPNWDQTHS